MASSELSTSHPMVVRGIDRVLTVQRPVVLAHIRSIRRGKPNATPDQIIATLERRYLAAVTTGGALVGASAAIPAVGTGASLALSSVETVGFLEASALFAQSITEVHGIVVEDPDRARALVMTMVLGSAGSDLVKQLAAQATGSGVVRSAYWGETLAKGMPTAMMGPLADRIKHTFVKKFAAAQGTNIVGRLVPFGIGAVIGGGGNHLLGRQIIRTARQGFGPAPTTLPLWLEPVVVLPRAPKAPKGPKAPKAPKANRALAAPHDGGKRKLRPQLPTLRKRRGWVELESFADLDAHVDIDELTATENPESP
ncbi:hypothetical protein [Salinibacterium sp. PAMC 21357]|uniref:hypothetical protein n=1 Tax=Salinibacterium sp. PAMC 21357 TaxID=1112215 RepID=UPI00192BEEAD|nr:hypothetical protein [Salinibacterium sp. PAMC 21357]